MTIPETPCSSSNLKRAESLLCFPLARSRRWLNVDVVQYLNFAMPLSNSDLATLSLTDIAFHAIATWGQDLDVLGNQ
jgi:hypothetical protein